MLLFRAKIPAAFDSIVMSVEDELKTRSKLAQEEGRGFVSLADFQAAFNLAAHQGPCRIVPIYSSAAS